MKGGLDVPRHDPTASIALARLRDDLRSRPNRLAPPADAPQSPLVFASLDEARARREELARRITLLDTQLADEHSANRPDEITVKRLGREKARLQGEVSAIKRWVTAFIDAEREQIRAAYAANSDPATSLLWQLYRCWRERVAGHWQTLHDDERTVSNAARDLLRERGIHDPENGI